MDGTTTPNVAIASDDRTMLQKCAEDAKAAIDFHSERARYVLEWPSHALEMLLTDIVAYAQVEGFDLDALLFAARFEPDGTRVSLAALLLEPAFRRHLRSKMREGSLRLDSREMRHWIDAHLSEIA